MSATVLSPPRITWPDGKQFAFTIVDDTDCGTVGNVGPVYQFLVDHGFLTTKTVWPLAPVEKPRKGGSTLEEPEYRRWILDLQRRGVEIAFHGATDHSSQREGTSRGLDRYRELLGADPRVYAAHTGQKEGMYWGEARLDGAARAVYRGLHRLKRTDCAYEGHVKASRYFWGDLCRERVTYVRNLVFPDINTLRRDPLMPYYDARRPYVRHWFSSSHASTIDDFCRLLSEENQDRLLQENGACIAYVHFGYGFVQDGRLNETFIRLMSRLSSLGGWCVPTSTLLDYLKTRPGWQSEVDRRVLGRMQWDWLRWKLRVGRT
jgi:hypothetical protein